MCMHLYVCLYVHVCACVCTHVGEGSLTLEDRTGRGGWGSRRERMEPWEKLEYSGVLWVEVSLLKGVPGKGGWGLASSRPSFRASAVCWGPSPAITSFPENGCARHCAHLSSQVIGVLTARRGSLAVCVLSESGPGHPGPPPPGRRR